MEPRQQPQGRVVSQLEQVGLPAYPTRDECDAVQEQDIEFFSGLLQGGMVAPAAKHKGDAP